MDLLAAVVAALIALAAVGLAVVTWRRSRPVAPSVPVVRRWSRPTPDDPAVERDAGLR